MLKKSLAWFLTLALILCTLSGMAVVSSAEEPGFVLASFASGERLYKNATERVYSYSLFSTAMAPLTGQDTDRYAVYMGYQNSQMSIFVPASAGLANHVTAEVRFRAHDDNQEGTRMALQYTNTAGDTDFAWLVMSGAKGQEIFTADTQNVQMASPAVISADGEGGWYTLKVELTDANYADGGIFSVLKWGHGNSEGDGIDGWYVESFMVYDTDKGRPSEEELYIRENTVGVLDFTGDEVEKELLSYTADETHTSIVEFDGQNALKISWPDNGGFFFHITADDVDQPAVKDTDENVTLLFETYVQKNSGNWNTRFCLQSVGEGERNFRFGVGHSSNATNGFEGYPWDTWAIMRWDLTDNDRTDFNLGTWFAGDCALYIRKVVVCRTELVSENTFDTAFVNFDEPYARYTDFQNVTTDSYRMAWSVSELATGDNYTLEETEGKLALTAPSGYLYLNVDDAFTKHNGANVADLGVTVTYLDKEGSIGIQYNGKTPANYDELTFDEKIPFMYVGTELPLTNTGEWKTATVYLSDAQFRNEQNGNNDLRLALNGNTVISAVEISIGADKRALNELINRPVNTALYTPETVAIYLAAKAAAQRVADDLYATKAQVDNAIANLQAAIDGLLPFADPRFTLVGAGWNIDACAGQIVVKDGWYTFKYDRGHWKWFGISDAEGILNDSTSVTYEYEVLFDTSTASDRCFLDFGDTMKWHQVEEGAAVYDADGFILKGNGFNAGGNWNPAPQMGEWGTIRLKNDHFDPTQLGSNNAVTALHSFFQEGDLYIRSVKVYDNDDESKFILLQFNEDVNDLLLTSGGEGVELTEKEGEQAWVIPSGWKALNISVDQLLADGTLTPDTTRFAVKISCWLEETDNQNELLMIKHYNPNGTGDNDNKQNECEHQLNHAQLDTRGRWTQYTFLLDDGLFTAADKKLNITYGNGEAVYIRGVAVYAVNEAGEMTSEKPARWGVILSDAQAAFTHPTYDWELDAGYMLQIRFNEGTVPSERKEDNGRKCILITDDFMYVNVDDTYITPNDRYVRIDFTHENGVRLFLQYNTLTPAGIDDTVEPNLTEYRFHDSRSPYVNEEGEAIFTDPLGILLPVNDENNNWMTTSIYLSDAQFRNAANGADFRVKTLGVAAISRIEVVKITEEEYNEAKAALGDQTQLKDLLAQVAAKYPHENTIPDELWVVYDYARKFAAEFGYRADQATVDALTNELKAAVDAADIKWGDADGDGEITSTDARLTLQLAVHKIKAEDIANADALDVDGDGDITSTDARLILQRAVKKIPAFPVETP